MNEMRRLINLVEGKSALKESAGGAKVEALATEFNQENDAESTKLYIAKRNPGTSTWTRMDGFTYREPGKIFVSHTPYGWDSQSGPQADALLQQFWDWLLSKGARPKGKLGGYFASDPYHDMVVYRGLLFVNRKGVIEWGSTSRLRNSAIWRQDQS